MLSLPGQSGQVDLLSDFRDAGAKSEGRFDRSVETITSWSEK